VLRGQRQRAPPVDGVSLHAQALRGRVGSMGPSHHSPPLLRTRECQESQGPCPVPPGCGVGGGAVCVCLVPAPWRRALFLFNLSM